MAITRHLAELILAEHRFRPIRGEVLLLGRQTVFMTVDEATALVRKSGLPISANARFEICKLPHGRKNNYISDTSFFSLFTDAVVTACDVTDYEGAEHIFDLSGEPPAHLLGRFDFIYNGSVLDNVFDPAACLRNTSRLLMPDGSILHYEGVLHWGAAYLKFSPDWFFDYYALNGFADVQIYVCTLEDFHASPWEVLEWTAYVGDGPDNSLPQNLPGPTQQMVIAVAQNRPGASVDRMPIQNVYRPDHAAYRSAFERVSGSGRKMAFERVVAASNPGGARARKLVELLRLRKPLPPGHRRLGRLGTPRAPERF